MSEFADSLYDIARRLGDFAEDLAKKAKNEEELKDSEETGATPKLATLRELEPLTKLRGSVKEIVEEKSSSEKKIEYFIVDRMKSIFGGGG